MYESSKISSISALIFFKSQTLEAENEEIDCYCFYAEMDENKNLIYYFTDPETDKYYIYTQGAAKEITNNSAQNTDDAAQLAKNAHNNLIVLSHKSLNIYVQFHSNQIYGQDLCNSLKVRYTF